MFKKIKKILSYKSNVETVDEILKNKIEDNKEKKFNNVSTLTQREFEMFHLLVEGYTLKECAAQLSIKYSTANTHMTSIYKKLEVNTKAELIIKYRGIKI